MRHKRSPRLRSAVEVEVWAMAALIAQGDEGRNSQRHVLTHGACLSSQ
jgi:hypothetical protein